MILMTLNVIEHALAIFDIRQVGLQHVHVLFHMLNF